MDININNSLGGKIACFSIATMVAFGGLVPNIVAAAETNNQEQVKTEIVEKDLEVKVVPTDGKENAKNDETTSKSEKPSQPTDKANEKKNDKDKTASKLLKDMKPRDEFSFGGRMWSLIDPAQGYAMMKETVADMKLENADFDKNNPNIILEYFDSVYYNELSKEDAALMESNKFGLTNFDKGLHVTAKFKSVAGVTKEGSLQDVSKATKETNKKTSEKGDKPFGVMVTGSLFILAGIIILVQNYVRRNKKGSKQ